MLKRMEDTFPLPGGRHHVCLKARVLGGDFELIPPREEGRVSENRGRGLGLERGRWEEGWVGERLCVGLWTSRDLNTCLMWGLGECWEVHFSILIFFKC